VQTSSALAGFGTLALVYDVINTHCVAVILCSFYDAKKTTIWFFDISL